MAKKRRRKAPVKRRRRSPAKIIRRVRKKSKGMFEELGFTLIAGAVVPAISQIVQPLTSRLGFAGQFNDELGLLIGAEVVKKVVKKPAVRKAMKIVQTVAIASVGAQLFGPAISNAISGVTGSIGINTNSGTNFM